MVGGWWNDMKRSAALIPLSRDHLHALDAAMRLRRADEETVEAAIAQLDAFWEPRGRRHFEIEEELLAPALVPDDSGWAAACGRIRSEHQAIREQISILRGTTGTDRVSLSRELGEALNDHVRYEDREAFGMLEE